MQSNSPWRRCPRPGNSTLSRPLQSTHPLQQARAEVDQDRARRRGRLGLPPQPRVVFLTRFQRGVVVEHHAECLDLWLAWNTALRGGWGERARRKRGGCGSIYISIWDGSSARAGAHARARKRTANETPRRNIPHAPAEAARQGARSGGGRWRLQSASVTFSSPSGEHVTNSWMGVCAFTPYARGTNI